MRQTRSRRGIIPRRDFLSTFGEASGRERGFKIKLPKLPIGRIIGGVVKDVVPGGNAIVSTANAAIHAIKNEKLQPGKILINAGQKAIDAGTAQIKSDLSKTQTGQVMATAEATSNLLVPVLLGVGILLLVRKGR